MIDGVRLRAVGRTEPAAEAGDEAALVARARADPAVFAPLYDRYLKPVYGYCLARLGTREAAEDATSQVFANALAALPTHRGGSFAAWLFAIAHNAVATAHRHPPDRPLPPDYDGPDPAPAPDAALLSDEAARELRALLAGLPEDQRRVIELRLAGLTGPEIARVLGRSHGAVRVLQFRAVSRLRAVLNGETVGSPGTELEFAL